MGGDFAKLGTTQGSLAHSHTEDPAISRVLVYGSSLRSLGLGELCQHTFWHNTCSIGAYSSTMQCS